MSLLLLGNQEKACSIADQICAAEHSEAPSYAGTAPGAGIPKDGLIQTIILLEIAVHYRDTDFFLWCGRWTYTMMSRRMNGIPDKARRMFFVRFCEMLKNQLWWLETDEERAAASDMLDGVIGEMKSDRQIVCAEDYVSAGDHAGLKKELLSRLLKRDLDGCLRLLTSAVDTLGLKVAYTDIVQNVMYEVGELWLQDKISVAQEHYCTAAVQSIMSSFYPRILEKPKNGKKAVVACAGSELHELGARMVSDLMEDTGWDCIFLGAAVPPEALLDTLEKEQPDLCILSVALQQGIPECADMISAIKKAFPKMKTAVGGHAFVELKKAGSQMGADLYARSFEDLLEQAACL